jgi:hypothetical protein
MKKQPKICRHCHAKTASRPRGLCWGCYYTPGIKEQYPKGKKAPHFQAVLRVCDACNRSVAMRVANREGWHSRTLPTHFSVKENFCPDCFNKWGWGDELTKKVYAQNLLLRPTGEALESA